ncbi:MAG: tetratricopeptide repeat protein [bacterium]|nr:tetratricopeptide repeat protein [bacterium]
MNEILNLLAWSGSAPMSFSLLAAVLDKEEELPEALKETTSAGVLKKATKGEGYEITPEARKERQEQFPLNDAFAKGIAQRLGDWFEFRRKESTDLPDFEAELEHLKEWSKHVKEYSSFHAARLTWLQAYPPYHRGKFQESLEQVQAAHSLLGDNTGDTDTGTFVKLKADIFHDFGAVYDELENTDEALKSYQKALEIQENHFGRQHADSAETIGNIAATYDRMGKQEEAVKYFEEALEIREQLFGEQHADTATSFNNIGTSYYEAKRYSDAISYLEKAVEIRIQVLGHEHTDTADSLYNLGICFVNLKKLKAAYELLNPFVKKLPPGHSSANELMGLLAYIDRESVKSGFRPMSSSGKGAKKKKKKKKKK